MTAGEEVNRLAAPRLRSLAINSWDWLLQPDSTYQLCPSRLRLSQLLRLAVVQMPVQQPLHL